MCLFPSGRRNPTETLNAHNRLCADGTAVGHFAHNEFTPDVTNIPCQRSHACAIRESHRRSSSAVLVIEGWHIPILKPYPEAIGCGTERYAFRGGCG